MASARNRAAGSSSSRTKGLRLSAPAEKLRARAERRLRKTPRQITRIPVQDLQKLGHELHVHQVELEMQNEELRETELELEEALDRYADLYNFAPTAYLTLNADAEILEANITAAKLLGLERGRLIHQKFTRFVPAKAQDTFYLFRRQVLVSNARQSVELDVVDATSKRSVVQLDAVGNPANPRKEFRVSLIDITARKQIAKELRRSEERYRTLVEHAPDGLFVADTHAGRFALVEVNSAACRMFGYTREEVLGRSMIDVVAAEEVPRVACEVAKLESGETAFTQWRLRRKDGSLFPAEVRARQIPDGRIQGFVRDLTQLKQSEHALRESEERFRKVTETIDQVFWMTTADKAQMLHVSPAYERIWGRTCQSLYDSPLAWLDAVHPEDRPRVAEAATTKQCTSEYDVQYRILRPDGSERWIHDRAFPIREASGKVQRIAGVAEDITARKQAEERIVRLDRAKAILAGVDSAILHLPNQQKLLDEICRVAVEKGDFRLAWIGMVSPDGAVQPVAQAGATGYLKGIRVATQDVPEGRGPVGTAIRENRPVVIENIDRNASMAPWQDQARQFGLHYAAAFPIRIADKVVGSFQLYAPRANSFDEEELGLMTQVSDEISFALTAISDLTARQRAEAALRESEARLQAFMDYSPAQIFLKDRQGRYLHVNRKTGEALHLSLDQAAGKTDAELLPPTQAEVFRASDQKMLAAGVPMDFEEVLLKDDGPHTVLVTKFPLHDAKGEIYAIGGIATDITERKRMEEALRRSEHNLSSFFAQAPLGLEWLSASGSILRANQAQLDLLGYASEEYLGHFFDEFCTDPAAARLLLEQLAAHQTVKALRLPRRHKDGTVRQVLVDAQSIWHEDQFLYSSVFSRDITERVDLERGILEISEREQRRIAQDLHDGLGQLLVGAAYLGSTLRQDLAAKSPPEVRQLDRLLEVLDEAIGQTRNLARGLHPVKPEPNGLMSALTELALRTKTLFNVGCRFICREPVLVENNTAATHLYRIAQEAVTNAIKHGKPGRIQICLTRTPGRLNLMVRDNGVGLAPKFHKKRGMGLRIMQYRTGVIGGSLAIQKEPGGGTAVICAVHEPARVLTDSLESATEQTH